MDQPRKKQNWLTPLTSTTVETRGREVGDQTKPGRDPEKGI